MFELIMENMGTILVSLILAGVVVLIVIRMYRDRKRGRSSCGCGCKSCPMSSSCSRNDNNIR